MTNRQNQHPRKIKGVHVDIEDLIKIQQSLSGLSLGNFHKLTSKGHQGVRSRGRGMDYEESRAYVVGDDVRAMDWQVMARTGEAHSKVFAEERERAFMLAIDLSTTMFFGTQFGFKSWAAAQVAAHIAWLANFSGARLGGLVATIDQLYQARPSKTRSGLMSLLSNLAKANEQALTRQQDLLNAAETDQVEAGYVKPGCLNAMLSGLRQLETGSTLIIISDFIGIDQQTTGLLQSLTRQHDLSAIWIHDVTEIGDWVPGPYPVQQGAQQFMLDTSLSDAAGLLLQQQQTHRNTIESLMAQFNIGLCEISCNQEVTEQLKPYLKGSFRS